MYTNVKSSGPNYYDPSKRVILPGHIDYELSEGWCVSILLKTSESGQGHAFDFVKFCEE